ncbi:MAG TPA: class I SAM-dependent methyltransferase [Candidatus Limnocylindrales bacterium]
MMFGTREPFTYRRCTTCGTLWLPDPPADLGPYYPATYFERVAEAHDAPGHWLRRTLTKARIRPVLFGRGERLGALASHLIDEPPELGPYRPLIMRYGIRSFSDRILDVGCGWVPARLCTLRKLGFRNLLGVDPFVSHDLVHHGIHVKRCELEDVPGSFDVIMFHHSLEHVRDPIATLKAAAAALRPRGRIVVRTPIAGSWFWDRFGVDWWELDPPRHLVVFTAQGLKTGAATIGLELVRQFYDSSMAEVIGSEQIARDLATLEPGSWFVDPGASGYDQADFDRMAADVRVLNAEGRAGRGGFEFKRVGPPVVGAAAGAGSGIRTP